MPRDQPHLNGPCSFLSLSVDIRVEIYKLVLGQKTLHFNDYFPELGNRGIFLCTASLPDVALFDRGEHCKAVQFAGLDIDKCLRCRHYNCYADWDGLQVSLLQVCRLIYLEAFLVPFAENTFIFPSREMVSRFDARLRPWQAAAVHRIILHQQNWWRYWREGIAVSKYRLHQPPFSKLRSVTIVVEFVVYGSFGGDDNRPDLARPDFQDGIVGAMADLVSETLKNVDVAIVAVLNPGAAQSYQATDMSRLEVWASRLRSMMKREDRLT